MAKHYNKQFKIDAVQLVLESRKIDQPCQREM